MLERLRYVVDGSRGRYVAEFIRWLPALLALAFYIAEQDTIFFTYAMAYALWLQLRLLRGL